LTRLQNPYRQPIPCSRRTITVAGSRPGPRRH
jgi:hypothetical protein